MHTVATASLLVLAGLSALAGCGDRPRRWEEPLIVRGPYRLRAQVVWLDATRGRAIALEPAPASGEPALRFAGLPRNASFAVPAPDGESLLILSSGQEAIYQSQQPEEPGLSVLRTPAGTPPELADFYPLPAAFDRLAVSPDGKRAVAYHGPGEGGSVFRNPNQLALLDLSRPPGPDNPLLRTVRSFGSAPLGVVFSPPMAVPAPSGPQRTLAVVLAENALTFLDLTHPERREITVPLSKPDSPAQVLPQEVSFSPATGTVLVRAEGAADLYSLTLQPQSPAAATDNDYRPSINQPSSGKTPLDMVLFSDGGKDLILTANASQDLSLIEAASSEFSIIPVGQPVDTLLAVPAESPRLVIAYSSRTPSRAIHFLELGGLGTALEKNLVRRQLDRPVHQLVAMPGGEQALIVHNDRRTVVSVLDLIGSHHTVSPIHGELPLQSFDFVASGQSTYLAGVSPGLARLGLLDLANLQPLELRLDHDPRRVLAVGEALVVDHEQSPGLLTVLPGPRATREESRTLWGFLYDDLLDGLKE